MSCTNLAHAPVFVWPAPDSRRRERPLLLWVIVALYESFHEALEMRRAAHKRYHLTDD
jgi:hypothetical protein